MAGLDQGERDPAQGAPGNEVGRAVDRVENPASIGADGVGAAFLLTEELDALRGMGKVLPDRPLDGEIDVADHVPITLDLHQGRPPGKKDPPGGVHRFQRGGQEPWAQRGSSRSRNQWRTTPHSQASGSAGSWLTTNRLMVRWAPS